MLYLVVGSSLLSNVTCMKCCIKAFFVFYQLYFQKKVTWKKFKLFKRTIQFAMFTLALYTSLTRISDYKHHWSDVMMGFFIGTVFAAVTVSFIVLI